MFHSNFFPFTDMALAPFRGISFTNETGYLCYCNSSVNSLLASEIICSNLVQSHCVVCSILLSKRSDDSHKQSSLLLKEHVANIHKQFNSSRQQDPSEFIYCLIQVCNILCELTKSEIISSFKCSNPNCEHRSDDSDQNERFKNVIHQNITGDSVAEIVSNASTNSELEWKKCLGATK